MKKLRKGDEVIITVGKDKGKRGKIERFYTKRGKVLIPGLNIYKRHLKKRDEKQQGGIAEFSRPIPVSNVSVVCRKCSQPTRVGFSGSGSDKQRICKKCKQII